MRQHQAELFRHERGVLRDDEPVGSIREVADQNPVETRLLVRLREPPHVVDVDRRSARRVNLRCGLRADHPDELDAHGRSPLSSGALNAARPAASRMLSFCGV